MQDEAAYVSIRRAVSGRWRRRFFTYAHLLIYLTAVAFPVNTITQQITPPQGLPPYTLITHEYILPFAGLVVWGVVLALHFLWAVFAELRDRATRREIERERKWRLLEQLDDYDPYLRERALRLAEIDNGELLDLKTVLAEREMKQKRT